MRLINTLKVVNDFTIEFNAPVDEENEENDLGTDSKLKYAILSHTWGWHDEKTGKWAHKVDEVQYHDHHEFSDPFDPSLHPDKRKAYQKMYHTCRCALELGFDYVWIDSCCIDKSNSAELTESINSMFQWYSKAAVCLIYLVDSYSEVTTLENGASNPRRKLYTKDNTPCRWFSRSWTLQELLASKRTEFYDNEWNVIGTLKHNDWSNWGVGDEFGDEIYEITKVDTAALMGVVPLWKYSVEAKMSWAANRKCGRAEDMAYSLLGIFDIHMPLVYGEGAKQAFQRLQLEIIKSTPDLSIFAWHIEQNNLGAQFCSLLSQSPSQFGFTRRICRSIPERHHTMTNKGIEMTSILYLVSIGQKERYFLCLEDKGETNKATGIFLRKIDYNMFQRAEGSLAEIQDLEICPSTHTSTFYISTSPRQHDPEVFSSHSGIIYVPPEYRVLDVVPEASWDCESRVLLGNMPCNDGVRALKLAVTIDEASMLVGLLFRSSNIAIVIELFENAAISEKLFTRTNKRKLMNWGELLSKVPELCHFSDHVKMKNGSTLRIRVVPEARHPHQLLIELEKTLKDLSLVPKSVKDAGSANHSKDTSQNIAQGFASMSETADGRWERLSASSKHTYGAQVGRYRKQDPILLPRAISDVNSSMTRAIASRSTISGRRR